MCNFSISFGYHASFFLKPTNLVMIPVSPCRVGHVRKSTRRRNTTQWVDDPLKFLMPMWVDVCVLCYHPKKLHTEIFGASMGINKKDEIWNTVVRKRWKCLSRCIYRQIHIVIVGNAWVVWWYFSWFAKRHFHWIISLLLGDFFSVHLHFYYNVTWILVFITELEDLFL